MNLGVLANIEYCEAFPVVWGLHLRDVEEIKHFPLRTDVSMLSCQIWRKLLITDVKAIEDCHKFQYILDIYLKLEEVKHAPISRASALRDITWLRVCGYRPEFSGVSISRRQRRRLHIVASLAALFGEHPIEFAVACLLTYFISLNFYLFKPFEGEAL